MKPPFKNEESRINSHCLNYILKQFILIGKHFIIFNGVKTMQIYDETIPMTHKNKKKNKIRPEAHTMREINSGRIKP